MITKHFYVKSVRMLCGKLCRINKAIKVSSIKFCFAVRVIFAIVIPVVSIEYIKELEMCSQNLQAFCYNLRN